MSYTGPTTTSFPTSTDAIPDPSSLTSESGDLNHPAHNQMHGWENDAIGEIEKVMTTGGRDKTGIYVPRDWGSNWLPKLQAAQAGTGLAKIGIRGDSVTYGYYTSNPLTASPAGVIAAALQGANGSVTDGGSGLQTQYSAFAVSNHGLASAITTSWNAAGNVGIATAGTWTANVTQWGPGNGALQTSTAGSTVTIGNLRGTQLKIYTMGNNGTTAPWKYSIDGAAAVNVTDTTTSLSVQTTTVTGLSAGTHSVVISYVGTGTFYFIAIEASNATGVLVDNFSIPGSSSASWVADIGKGSSASGLWAGGSANPVDLLIYELAVNDCQYTTSTGITLSAATATGATSFTMSAYLPPGKYLIPATTGGNEIVYVQYVTGTSAPYTAHVVPSMAYAHASAAAISLPTNTAQDWLKNAHMALADARSGEWGGLVSGTQNGAVDIILVLPHVGRYDAVDQYQTMAALARGLAESYGAALVDEWALGRNSWTYYNGLGYWGSSATVNTVGTDSVHRTDAGAAALANAIIPVIQGVAA